nr:exosporium glycoprotein BclB-related protein [Brevibacillus laterosporus]
MPFASGTPLAGGLAGTRVGFGSSAPTVFALGTTIDLTGAVGTLLNFAYTVPRDGIITSISAYFSTTATISLIGTTVTITAQLYSSPTPNNTFNPVQGTIVTLAIPVRHKLVY